MKIYIYIYIYIYIWSYYPEMGVHVYVPPTLPPPSYPSSARRIDHFYLRFVSSKTAISQMLICLSGRCCSMLIFWPLTLGSQKNEAVSIPAMLCKPGKHSDSSPSIGPTRITYPHNIYIYCKYFWLYNYVRETIFIICGKST